MTPELHHSTLSNGIHVLSQPTPGHQGASIAIHLASGSRDEDLAIGGASHFIEHLLFKGTEKRTAHQITSEFDAIGVDPNAGTGHESVNYHLTVLREYLPQAFEILSDMFLNSTFPEKDIETERNVILEEITRADDDHAHFLANQFSSGFWGEHPLGRPVIGYQDTILNISREELMTHFRRQYQPSRTIVSAAGNVDHAELVALSEELLGGFAAPGCVQPTKTSVPNSTFTASARHNLRDMQQVQLYLGYPALLSSDERYWAFQILNNVLGCGMGSRLFREVREVRGLAYSVGSAVRGYSDSAALIVYAGCDVAHAQETVDICHREVNKLIHERLTPAFLGEAKRQARGRHLLGLDDSCSQAAGIAHEFAQLGRARSVAEYLACIEAATPKVIQEIAEELFCRTLPRLESIGPEVSLSLPS